MALVIEGEAHWNKAELKEPKANKQKQVSLSKTACSASEPRLISFFIGNSGSLTVRIAMAPSAGYNGPLLSVAWWKQVFGQIQALLCARGRKRKS